MSYKLQEILEELDGAGMIAVDEDRTVETLNESFGINIHHDLVITSHEAREIRGLLDYLTNHEDEYIRKSSKFCIELLENK